VSISGAEHGHDRPANQRDQHIRLIAVKGRMVWQKATGRRNLVETTIGRYKQLIGLRRELVV
jgi:hypothetical protein